MDHSAPNFALPKFLSRHFATVRFLYRSLCLLFFAGLMGGAVAAADVPNAHVASPGPNLSFSVADFDGDSKPDLASVQTGKSDLTRAAYRIQLQLSSKGSCRGKRFTGLQDADAHRALQFIGNLAVDRPRIVASQFDKHCEIIAYYLSSKLV